MEKKKAASTNDAGITGCQHVVTKLKPKWIKGLNINISTLKLREEKVRSSLQYIGIRDHILNITLVVESLRATMNKCTS